MSLDADTIVDRRRMRRKLTFWRVFAVLMAIVAVVRSRPASRGSSTRFADRAGGATIARVKIRG